MESDHCQVIQSHLYYRYTNGQKHDTVAECFKPSRCFVSLLT